MANDASSVAPGVSSPLGAGALGTNPPVGLDPTMTSSTNDPSSVAPGVNSPLGDRQIGIPGPAGLQPSITPQPITIIAPSVNPVPPNQPGTAQLIPQAPAPTQQLSSLNQPQPAAQQLGSPVFLVYSS